MSNSLKGLLRPGMPIPSQSPSISVASPLNDVQLVALMASNMSPALPEEKAVERALEIVAQTMARIDGGSLKARTEAIKGNLNRLELQPV